LFVFLILLSNDMHCFHVHLLPVHVCVFGYMCILLCWSLMLGEALSVTDTRSVGKHLLLLLDCHANDEQKEESTEGLSLVSSCLLLMNEISCWIAIACVSLNGGHLES
jgi:hypothetical protein